ncbi:MAG TPA: EamA family transporter [candidate division Zixibacteria bacterium]|nr:EamA family transporter [candidate division Zixibacteria bacterium]
MDPGIVYGLGAAAAFGTGDFAGGLAARRVSGLAVSAAAQAVGLVLLLVAVAFIRPEAPAIEPLLLGAAAGASGGIGLAALYRGLSLGSMGVVTALSGVGSTAVPLLVGALLLGDAMSGLQLVGVMAAMAAAAAASGATRSGVRPEAIRLAALAALTLGLWFVFLDLGAEHDELWALVASRASAAVLIGALAVARGEAATVVRGWRLVAVAGTLDVTGNAAFVLARGEVPVGVAAALSGLYPVVTMLLARSVTGERLPLLALAAVGLAVTGIVLISIG